EVDALLQLPLAGFELLDLGQHRSELTRLHLGSRDVGVELRRLLAKRPEPPEQAEDGGQEDHGGADGHALRRGNRDARGLLLLLRALALDGKQVDPNHRSPARLNARPTATAAVGAISAGLTLNFFASNAIRLNGSNVSTGASKRSASISVKPSARDAPPLTTIRWSRSDAAVALKKSNVFWISSITFSVTARSTG